MKHSQLKQLIKEEIENHLNEDASQLVLIAAAALQLHNFKYIWGKDQNQANKSPIFKVLNILVDIARTTRRNVKDVVSPEVKDFLEKEDKKLKK
tara:strand:+ start:54 stop:335 length:282 start_codon:yes stop_codon:yes gene_type:complete